LLFAEFCLEALNEAIHEFGPPEIMNTDQGSQFTSFDWTDRLKRAKTKISWTAKAAIWTTLGHSFEPMAVMPSTCHASGGA